MRASGSPTISSPRSIAPPRPIRWRRACLTPTTASSSSARGWIPRSSSAALPASSCSRSSPRNSCPWTSSIAASRASCRRSRNGSPACSSRTSSALSPARGWASAGFFARRCCARCSRERGRVTPAACGRCSSWRSGLSATLPLSRSRRGSSNMCGIGGFFALQPVAPRVANAMRGALSPRGPDAEHAVGWDAQLARADGTWHNALVHARLSIIDPRPVADQPMANGRGDVWIAYNGEVYDWEAPAQELRRDGVTFRTRADTEFILRGYEAWGIEALLAQLRGMFAFAIVDLGKRKVYLARDRMGEKPLVYTSAGEELAFGSLVRSVLPFLPTEKRTLSPEGIDAYLAHRYIPAPRT